jgi:hypothetical protein
MSVEVNINGITGQSPYNIYICQSGGTDCFFIDTITTTTYQFLIPSPYDTSPAYMLKIIDANNCIISGQTLVS